MGSVPTGVGDMPRAEILTCPHIVARFRVRVSKPHREVTHVHRRPRPLLIRLYLSWMLTAISGIGIVVMSVSMTLDLDATYEAMQDTLLILSVTAYLCGWVNGTSEQDDAPH